MVSVKQLSTLTTSTGTKVQRYLESPMRKGYGHVVKRIQYPSNSPIAKLGVDSVSIRNAGKEGKHIMAFNGNKCVATGVTNPSYPKERPIQVQLKEIFNAMKLLRSKSLIH